jgi:metal-responsive CopG/Arc/MetJ family transcriptional regulator
MKNTQAISVTIPTELAHSLERLQKHKMKNYSAIVTEAVREYVLREEYEELAAFGGKKAKAASIMTEEDIDKAVHEVKKSAKHTKNNR